MATTNGTSSAAAEENPAEMMRTSIENGRVDVLRSLLSEIVSQPEGGNKIIDDPKATPDGTLLHYAVKLKDADSVRTLLTSGVSPSVMNGQGKTPMQLPELTDKVHSAFVQELLQAVAQSKLGRVCQLLSAGISIDCTDSPTTRNTPLHWAASFGNDDVLKVLLEGGATVNLINARGETALHDAVSRGDVTIVKRLLQYRADPSVKSGKTGKDSFAMAASKPAEVLQCLSRHNVTTEMQKADSIDSLVEVSSITSFSTRHTTHQIGNGPQQTAAVSRERFILAQNYQIEEWTDYLWPQPKFIQMEDRYAFNIPADRKLRIYFGGDGHPGNVRRIMQICTTFTAELASRRITLEWGEFDLEPSMKDIQPELLGISVNIIPQIFQSTESYSLAIKGGFNIQLLASDLLGLKQGLCTLSQIIRATSKEGDEEIRLPSVTIRDGPDTKYRSIFYDFTGIRVLAVDTLCAVAARLSYCKANQLIVHFEIRPTDTFSLPYSSKELFHLRQVCDDLSVTLIPSLDLNSRNVESAVATKIVHEFVQRFPVSNSDKLSGIGGFHFGEYLSPVIVKDAKLLDFVHRSGALVYLSFETLAETKGTGRPLPPYVITCLPGSSLLTESAQSEAARGLLGGGLCLKFPTSDVGYLCQAPESMVKNAIIGAKLGQRCPVIGTMVCDLASGCEIVPQSMAYLPSIAILGTCWNRSTDMKRFCFLLPQIGAEHILLQRDMACLFQQILSLGYIEHELTKLAIGPLPPKSPRSPAGAASSPSAVVADDLLSVFVNLLLNPDAILLERLTPVTFKKARVELSRSLTALNEVKKTLPYSYDLALTLAEIQLVTELMILATRMGQSLCLHGRNPREDIVGFNVINVGVANLPLTARTDLANLLLEIRNRFQHSWLSRNQPVTLPNALKLFDNLFRTLLPPDMQSLGQQLL